MNHLSASDAVRTKVWAGRQISKLVVHSIFEAVVIYTFNVHGLELLRAACKAGVLGIVEQTIAPKAVERKLLADDHERYPDSEDTPKENPYEEDITERERAEWEAASMVMRGSEFVRHSIRECGGPIEKCVVAPYGVDTRNFSSMGKGVRRSISKPLRVLTVGSFGLRKGSPYVLEAAKLLGERAAFRMVGGASFTKYGDKQLNEAVDLKGGVPRSEVSRHYDWADVFLLPSLCEGSATVTYEAMAHGLPVICTPNTGSIARDGKDGFIVPIRDAEAIAERIIRLSEDEDLHRQMAKSARGRAVTHGSLEAYGKRLIAAVRSVCAKPNESQLK